MAFHRFHFSDDFTSAICLKYASGGPDVHNGGFQNVLWRTFVIELRNYPPTADAPLPDPFDERITDAMSDMREISEDSGLDLVHSFQASTVPFGMDLYVGGGDDEVGVGGSCSCGCVIVCWWGSGRTNFHCSPLPCK